MRQGMFSAVLTAACFSLFLSSASFAGLEEGLAAIDREDYDAAFFELSNAAKLKDPEAQYYLGLLYLNGKGAEKNPGKAKELFEFAADAGYPPAQYQLARFLLDHLKDSFMGMRYNRALAVYWMRMAGYNGVLDAQLALSEMYVSGEYLEKDPVQAYAWLKRASRQYPPGEERNDVLARLIVMGEGMTLEQIDLARQYAVADRPYFVKPQ